MKDTGRGQAAGGIRCLSRGNWIVSDERQPVSSATDTLDHEIARDHTARASAQVTIHYMVHQVILFLAPIKSYNFAQKKVDLQRGLFLVDRRSRIWFEEGG